MTTNSFGAVSQAGLSSVASSSHAQLLYLAEYTRDVMRWLVDLWTSQFQLKADRNWYPRRPVTRPPATVKDKAQQDKFRK